MSMKYLVRLVVAFALTGAGFAMLVQAGESDTVAHGGNGGDTGFRLSCGQHGVLVGVSWSSGYWLDSLRAYCIRLSPTNGWRTDEEIWSNAIHGSGGLFAGKNVPPLGRAECPRDTSIAGISGTYGWYVNKLTLRCRPLVPKEPGSNSTSHVTESTIKSIYVAGSQAGDHSFNTVFCPDNKPARGLYGRDGDSIDSIGLICHTGTDPICP